MADERGAVRSQAGPRAEQKAEARDAAWRCARDTHDRARGRERGQPARARVALAPPLRASAAPGWGGDRETARRSSMRILSVGEADEVDVVVVVVVVGAHKHTHRRARKHTHTHTHKC